MNTTQNTERPKLKLNYGAKPLILTTNSNANLAVAGHKAKVGSNVNQDATKSEVAKKSNKQTDFVSKNIVVSPEEILKEKIKRRKKEYFSILTKLQADFPEVFSEEPKPLAIGINVELKKILNGQFLNNQLRRFFHRYCGSFKYKEKLVEGARRFHLDGSPASLVTKKEVPVMAHKPRFVKKARDASDNAKTASNEIEHQYNE